MSPFQDRRSHHVSRWHSSGLSRAAYCREHGLAYQPFLAWTKQAAIADPKAAFIELPRPSTAVAESLPSPLPTIALPDGLMLRVAPGTDVEWIGRVVAAVRRC